MNVHSAKSTQPSLAERNQMVSYHAQPTFYITYCPRLQPSSSASHIPPKDNSDTTSALLKLHVTGRCSQSLATVQKKLTSKVRGSEAVASCNDESFCAAQYL